ncbi:MAG: Flagellar biosynthesis regulator FlhF [uncultured bacterium]|nr:MAG: Flagellar biosynthesis regulator FlhF [uncultured bacterium]
MKLKKYIVSNLSEAIFKIKKDLGDDAVIVSTRKVKKKDLWWKPVKQKVEVTAVVDMKGDTDIDQLMGKTALSSPMRLISRIAEEKITPVVRELDKIKNEFFKMNHVAPAKQKVQPATLSPAKPAIHHDDVSLRDEMVMNVVSSLLWHRVDEKYVSEIADVMMQLNFDSIESLKEKLAEYMLENLPTPAQTSFISDQHKVHIVLGQKGAGKSSAIIKLATQYVLQGGKKVAFITFGKNRKVGDSLLHKYAAILKAPCAIAKNDIQYQKQILRFESSDLIFVECDMDDAETLSASEMLGVVSSHVSYVSAINDKPAGPDVDLPHVVDSFIISHLDATSRFGDLLNLALKYQKPFLAFLTGTQIPEDFEEASLERVVDCLLNFSGNHPVQSDLRSNNENYANEGVYQ